MENVLGTDPTTRSIRLTFLILIGLCLFLWLDDVILLGIFVAVPPLNYGLKYDDFWKSADTQTVHEPGRYFLGLFRRFLLFPSNVQTLEFVDASTVGISQSGTRLEPLHVRTRDGVAVFLQVSLQYQLMKHELGNLYMQFNMDYEQVYSSIVRDIVVRAVAQYEAVELWEERQACVDRMRDLLADSFRRSYSKIFGLQLLIIDLPEAYENSIVRTQLQRQELHIKTQVQASTNIRAQTMVLQAEYARQVKVIMAEGHANYTVTTQAAHAKAQQHVLDYEALILGNVSRSLGLKEGGLVFYQKYMAVDEIEDAFILSGFGGAKPVQQW